jgi:hypothetical protein
MIKYNPHLVIIYDTLPGSGEVKWVNEAQRCCSSSTTGRKITKKVTSELGVFVYSTKENGLILVLEGKVKRLCGKITNDVGQVSTPETEKSLFFGNTNEAIDHTYKNSNTLIVLNTFYQDYDIFTIIILLYTKIYSL